MFSKESLYTQIDGCISLLARVGNLNEGSVIVFGASTSEVAGNMIGQNSVPELGEVIAEVILEVCERYAFKPVFQCCEHLNRALVMEMDLLKELGLTQVNAFPQPKAGGSVPTAAYKRMNKPVLAQFIQADAGVDIGDTLIGMHLRPVAVPVHMPNNEKIGHAHVVMAYSRLPYIGGSRANYL